MFHTYATSVQTSHGRACGDHVGQCEDSLRLNLIIQRLWVTKSCLLSGNGGHGFLSATTTRSVSSCPVAALPLSSPVLKPWGPCMLCALRFTPALRRAGLCIHDVPLFDASSRGEGRQGVFSSTAPCGSNQQLTYD